MLSRGRTWCLVETGVASDFQPEPKQVTFEEAFLPHLDAAYNLARWLTQNEDDAKDVVQEAYLRALRFFNRFQGSDGRAWLLKIVRNTCYTWLKRNRPAEHLFEFDETIHVRESNAPDPESALVRSSQKRLIGAALEKLPAEFREVMVLRKLEELSYKQIARVVGIPLGTVMSRLARARKKLQASISGEQSYSLTRSSSVYSLRNEQAGCTS